MLGLCLIVSAFERPEIGFHVAGYLGDMVLGQVMPGLIGVTWLLTVVGGIGLVAARRWACLLVYVAALYTLLPSVSGFSFVPFVPFLVPHTEFGVLVGNAVFVLLVARVHWQLCKNTRERLQQPIEVRRRSVLSTLWLSALAVAVSSGAFAALLVVPWWDLSIDYVVPRMIISLLLIIALPLAVLGLSGVVISCIRLWLLRRTRSRMEQTDRPRAGDVSCPSTVGDRRCAASQFHCARHRFQFTLRSLLLTVPVVSLASAVAVAVWNDVRDPSRYNRHFQQVVAWADRIVVREGGFNCCGPVEDDTILFEVVDPHEIEVARQNIRFVAERPQTECMCCGYPGIDWYRGHRRIALTAVQHGVTMRWRGFPGDARLTEQSSQWLKEWLSKRHKDEEPAS